MMGWNAEAVGNHSFDRGEQFLRNELIPLADFPVISANVVFPDGTTPPEWSPSATFNFDGNRVGLVGFTTEDTPSLLFPGRLGPFEVVSVVDTVQAEANRLRGTGIKVIVALGHEGANGGTVTEPTGPLIDIADSLTGVDVVMGDHNDVQVNATRSNGVLVTENRGKGIRFTRVRIVVDRHWRGRLQDGRLPQAVDDRDHARPADPGARSTSSTRRWRRSWARRSGSRRGRFRARTRAVGRTGGCASRSSATSSPTRCGRRTAPTSRSPTREASGRT